MPRSIEIKPGVAVACPECGNTTKFVMHSHQAGEDFCEIWVECVCGHDATVNSTGDRIEDTWGGTGDEHIADAIRYTWNALLYKQA
jgi:hypothetical protein